MNKAVCKPIGTILAPVDVSPHSYNTVANAVAMAEKFGGKVVYLHIINSHMFEGLKRAEGRIQAMDGLYEQAVETVKEERTESLDKFLAECEASRTPFETVIEVGVPWQVILDKAEEVGAGLIVMGTMGRGSLFKQIRFGSSAEKVFRRASCRVMFVR